ncbi:exodeoxyribonuclease VII large subunit [Xanthomonas cucurbitae]
MLEGSFPLVWVEAELSSVTRPSSGHLYFTLRMRARRSAARCSNPRAPG